MTADEDRQNALAYTWDAFSTAHKLRALADRLTELGHSGIRECARLGLSQAIVADAAALTPGRVSQIVSSGPIEHDWRSEVHRLVEWPGDALRTMPRFEGRMTMPPYPRRRASRGGTSS